MLKFELYLEERGLGYRSAKQFSSVASKYLTWLKENNLIPSKVKRSRFLDFIESLNLKSERTKEFKERGIARYHEFLGTKNNPAKRWLKRRRFKELPPPLIEKSELARVYTNEKPKSPAEYRDRCMLGLILFQGLRRSELEELRISDINFEEGTVFIEGHARTNSRTLELDAKQNIHLYDYLQKYRKEFVLYKSRPTDRFFLSKGTGEKMGNALGRLMKRFKVMYPHLKSFKDIRASVITHWEKEGGIMYAMEKAGHKYVTSTARYQESKLDEIKEELMVIHPLEKMNLN